MEKTHYKTPLSAKQKAPLVKKRRRRRRHMIIVLTSSMLVLAAAMLIVGATWLFFPQLTPHIAPGSSTEHTVAVSEGSTTAASATVTESAVGAQTQASQQANAVPKGLPDSAAVTLTVPKIRQNPELPAGCEVTSAAMLLQAYGYSFTKLDVANAVPLSKLETYNGRRYAAHPNDAFVGSPYEGAFGIYSGALAQTMDELLRSTAASHHTEILTGCDENTLLSYIAANRPVCIWVTMGLKKTTPGITWYIKRGDTYTEETYTWRSSEHCVVLTGYTPSTVTVNDPLASNVNVTYNRTTFFTRWKEQGQHALVLSDG